MSVGGCLLKANLDFAACERVSPTPRLGAASAECPVRGRTQEGKLRGNPEVRHNAPSSTPCSVSSGEGAVSRRPVLAYPPELPLIFGVCRRLFLRACVTVCVCAVLLCTTPFVIVVERL